MSWGEALAAAPAGRLDAGVETESLTGYLATITTAEENDFMVDFVLPVGGGFGGIQGSPNAWLGATDSNAEGEWLWVTGPEAGRQFWTGGQGGTAVGGLFNDWEPGEPNNLLGEDFLRLESNGGFGAGWNDAGSLLSGTADGYIVEFTRSSVAVPEVSMLLPLSIGILTLVGFRMIRDRWQRRDMSAEKLSAEKLPGVCLEGAQDTERHGEQASYTVARDDA